APGAGGGGGVGGGCRRGFYFFGAPPPYPSPAGGGGEGGAARFLVYGGRVPPGGGPAMRPRAAARRVGSPRRCPAAPWSNRTSPANSSRIRGWCRRTARAARRCPPSPTARP